MKGLIKLFMILITASCIFWLLLPGCASKKSAPPQRAGDIRTAAD